MELRVLAQESGKSPSVSESDPDEKEISDDDDDDRNHKHRRRDEARSQSLDRDVAEQVFTKPHRRGNKSFGNGQPYKEVGSQSSETWKKYTFNPMEKDISVKFDKRRPGFSQFSREPSDTNQRIRVNQTFSGVPGPVRGRGRDTGLWSQHDSRFSSFDIASQIVQQGPVPSSLFAGRGLPTVTNAHGVSWGAFGLVPGISNGGLDTLHPLGLQGTYRSAIGPALNMGFARQRCRDFEEQGFCLRGDMCPMEHGVNRIVVEDVQSLSQFNLPVSLPSANLPGAPAAPGPFPATSAPTNPLLNNKGSHGKTFRRGVGNNGVELNGTFIDSIAAGGADFYDPDQPLWGNDSQTSPALQSINQSNVKEDESLLDSGPPDHHRVGEAMGSQSTSSSVWGRISNTKNRNNVGSSLKTQTGNGRSVRNPSQKAQRTLFVNGIPQQNNKRESLLSHFQKFGEVIDIYIPLNSERAFVQFSKREEAEAALMAPDAVMGNRFIKLLWANRDNISDNGTTSGHNVPINPRGVAVSPYVASKRKDPESALDNVTAGSAFGPHVPASDRPKPVAANGQKAPPPLQKKMENLEVLKEELRKKQEMLDQKRNDFRRKLDKLEKHATDLKGEVTSEQVAKKQKSGIVADSTKAATASSSDPNSIQPSSRAEVIANSSKPVDRAVPQSSKSTATVALQGPSSLKPSIRPLAPSSPSVVTNRFKLDNRPTAFKIISPLPNGLANVAVLKEHFSPYGELSKVELDDTEPTNANNNPETSKASARIYFVTRNSAEKAFFSGKIWKAHNLQFTWLKSSNCSKDLGSGENQTSKVDSDASVRNVVENSKTFPLKPEISGDEESEKPKRMDIDKEHTEPDENNISS